jgi:hypothetical protein
MKAHDVKGAVRPAKLTECCCWGYNDHVSMM